MTLDLDELERKAKESARYHGSGEWHIYKGDVLCGNGSTVVCDPGDVDGEYLVAASPAIVLALIERVRELEKRYVAPSQWRCDGCGCIERPIDGRRPDMHHGCGGMWIRQERTENA